MFVDRAEVVVHAGKGGDGHSSFRREKFVPLGGPDGGDGGAGGDVYFEANANTHTLVEYRFHPSFRADDGGTGEKGKRTGRDGKDKILFVAPGTVIRDHATRDVLADLVESGQRFCIAEGGRGGRGNARFMTSTRQAPRQRERGEPGDSRKLLLELRLIADVGFVGFPNAGKSSLLARVSAARPKVADYPFTTLEPMLGVVRVDMETSFVAADLPGLIEGAHLGAGLGHEFLRHVERTRLIVHLLDFSPDTGRTPLEDYAIIRRELTKHDPALGKRREIVAANKMDLAEARKAFPALAKALARRKVRVLPISAATGEGIAALVSEIARILPTIPPPPPLVVLRARLERETGGPRFTLERAGEVFVLDGREIRKWVAMTDFDNDEAIWKLRDILTRLGVEQALRDAGVQEGDTIRVGDDEFTYVP